MLHKKTIYTESYKSGCACMYLQGSDGEHGIQGPPGIRGLPGFKGHKVHPSST